MSSSHRTRWFRAGLLLLAMCAGLAGCGQKGPLFMPPPAAESSEQTDDSEQEPTQPATAG